MTRTRKAKNAPVDNAPVDNTPVDNAPVENQELILDFTALSDLSTGIDLGLAPETKIEDINTAPKWKRLPSLNARDHDGKVIRSGRNLSGNVPYTYKFYRLTAENVDRDRMMKLPRQARILAETLLSCDQPMIGKFVTALARDKFNLVTPIDDAVLFAYYRRALESIGMRQV